MCGLSALRRGLSETFLEFPGPKLLALAGRDRLDRVLTMGQMMGKFQVEIFPHSGHPIQEGKMAPAHCPAPWLRAARRRGSKSMTMPRAQ